MAGVTVQPIASRLPYLFQTRRGSLFPGILFWQSSIQSIIPYFAFISLDLEPHQIQGYPAARHTAPATLVGLVLVGKKEKEQPQPALPAHFAVLPCSPPVESRSNPKDDITNHARCTNLIPGRQQQLDPVHLLFFFFFTTPNRQDGSQRQRGREEREWFIIRLPTARAQKNRVADVMFAC